MELHADACYRIIQARDARSDGAFFFAAARTGVYCRPICPARTPARRGVRFFPAAAAAEAAGFRPCRRCRPEAAPGAAAWKGAAAAVGQSLKLIERGFLDEHSVSDLASALGMGESRLRDLFDEHLGAAPAAVAQSRRTHFAARILRETGLPLAQVARSAGFGSVRRLNDAFRSVFVQAPGELRRAAGWRAGSRPAAASFTLTLSYRPPYQWEKLLEFFRVRAVRGVEEVDDVSYRRSITLGDEAGTLDVCRANGVDNALSMSVTGIGPALLGQAVHRVRRMFDLDADPSAVRARLFHDSRLAKVVRALPGLRLPVTWDPFEAVVRAVLGQQVSVAGAITIAGRLARRCGRPVEGDSSLTRVFPSAADLAHADLSGLGVPGARMRALTAVARAVLCGSVRFDFPAPWTETCRDLTAIRGIGPWSAQYVALRGRGEPDAFPATDLGIRKAMDLLGYPEGTAERDAAIRRLAPWRGYAALYLWSTLSSGG